jgi:AcrR family transcriptional regulator
MRRGRRPGRSETKTLILGSARHLFAVEGYEQTSIRGVAEKAGVDPALVMHYFSSKEGLFRAAIDWPFDMDEAARRVFEGDPIGMGDRLVRMVCEVWEDDTTRHPLTVILRNAVQREEAARLASEFVEREMVGRVAGRTQEPTAALRGALAHSAVIGLVMARYVIGVEPLASAPVETVVQAVGPTIQRYLTGDIGGPI